MVTKICKSPTTMTINWGCGPSNRLDLDFDQVLVLVWPWSGPPSGLVKRD